MSAKIPVTSVGDTVNVKAKARHVKCDSPAQEPIKTIFRQLAFLSSKQMAYTEFWFCYSACPSFSSWLQRHSSGY